MGVARANGAHELEIRLADLLRQSVKVIDGDSVALYPLDAVKRDLELRQTVPTDRSQREGLVFSAVVEDLHLGAIIK